MALELTEIEIGEIPPTPSSPDFSTSILFGIGLKLVQHAKKYGTPVAYKQEQNGRLIQNLIPIKQYENDQISGSSKVQLEFHTESAFHPYKPSHIHLLCLRGDENAATTYAEIDDITQHLSEQDIETLQQPHFETGIDKSFQIGGAQNIKQLITPLRKYGNSWELCYDGELTTGINPAATDALNNLRNAIKLSQKEIALKTGQIATIDNKTTVHGRKPFQARYDGTDRWLQRILSIRYSIPKNHLDGNIITTEFRVK